jgi:hypothetical protein
MKKVVMAGISVLLLGALFIVLKTGRETGEGFQVKGSSFLEDITIVQKDSGRPLWTLTASKADFKDSEDKAELRDISLVMEKDHVTLRVDKGVYNLAEGSFSTGSTVKANSQNYNISADSLDYDVSSGRIQTKGRIQLESKGCRVEGEGMKSDSGQKVSILNDVKATFNK